MKSRGSANSRQNPRQTESTVGRTSHRTQVLSKKKKDSTVRPVHQQDGCQLHTFEKREHVLSPTDGQPVFTEIWPSIISSPTSASDAVASERPAAKPSCSTELGDQQDSVLAKYIERFRHGQPQSRAERQRMASVVGEEKKPFWWSSSSSLPSSSTPTKTRHRDHSQVTFSPAERQLEGSPSSCRGPHHMLSDTFQSDFDETDDTEILCFQERAATLLQSGDCFVSDRSVPVRSEGLGCSDFSLPVSVEEPARRPFPSLMTSSAKARSDSCQAASSRKSPAIPSMVPAARPEEDILVQWRLWRKKEQTREWAHSQQHSSLHSSTFNSQGLRVLQSSVEGRGHKQKQSVERPGASQRVSHSYIRAHQSQATTPPALSGFGLSGSSVPQHQALPHVPAHMHLLCDVLPCPIQSPHASTQENISRRQEESSAKDVTEKTHVPGNLKDTSNEQTIGKRLTSSPPPPSRPTKGDGKSPEKNQREKAQTNDWERDEMKKERLTRKQMKHMRCPVDSGLDDGHGSASTKTAHQPVQKKKTCKSQQPPKRCPDDSHQNLTSKHAPPSSPVRSALGQVVSEVLFPPVDSASESRTRVSSDSPPQTDSAHPLCNVENSTEVISQLLQEADDSDEKEFEDDPLLQVLRKQRKWVKEQIRDVDCMLDSFLLENKLLEQQQTPDT